MKLKYLSLYIITIIVILTPFLFGEIFGKKAITLKEAYDIGLVKAKEWDSGAFLTHISTVDRKIGNDLGSDGKRRSWNLTFEVPTKKKSLFISIDDNKIEKSISRNSTSQFNGITQEEIGIDSPQIASKAIQSFNLRPGENWAIGYHFTMFKQENQLFLTVVGRNEQNKFSKIYFNPKNGEYLGMQVNDR
ncbi:hypothetical protein [Brevibacillus brevis]|uniref:hypothetical protein n=1 Tax=Brevibacillus brevis TaxID=1393 RepID=UPI0025A4F8F7|nr:hypothetical protein [Brevibacillus brevis]WJQ79477.1 hypothetical protein QN310_18480 [Brevibacillus brevis]